MDRLDKWKFNFWKSKIPDENGLFKASFSFQMENKNKNIAVWASSSNWTNAGQSFSGFFALCGVCLFLLLFLVEGQEKRVEERVWCHLKQYSHPEEIVSKHPKLLQLPSCEANKLRKAPTQEEVKHPCVPIWNSLLTCLRP